MNRRTVSALVILVAAPLGSVLAQAPPVAGRDYVEIPNGEPFEPAAEGKVVVEEFFNYICPACYAFEPYFAAWQEQLASYVEVAHIAAAFRPDFVQYARAYYAAEAFGLTEDTHAAVYDAVHLAHTIPAEGDRPDEAEIAAFYSEYGVDADEFLATMQSFGVDLKIRRATQYMQECRITGTPSIVINGRYLVMGATYDDVLRTASYLIEKERSG